MTVLDAETMLDRVGVLESKLLPDCRSGTVFVNGRAVLVDNDGVFTGTMLVDATGMLIKELLFDGRTTVLD